MKPESDQRIHLATDNMASRDGLSHLLSRAALLLPLLLTVYGAFCVAVNNDSVQARTLIVALLASSGILLSFVPGVSRVLSEISFALVSRIAPKSFALLALVAIMLASGPNRFQFYGLFAALLTLSASSWIQLRRIDSIKGKHEALILIVWGVGFVPMNIVVAKYILPFRSHDRIFTQYDPLLGWRLRPSYKVSRIDSDYTSVESTNEFGFRTPQIAAMAQPGVLRVLMLGDSHTEGYTVNDDETVAALLGKDLGREVEVISLGVAGYSTDQEYLSYLAAGRSYSPDIVTLQFCSNDIDFNTSDSYWRGSKPLFKRYGNQLLLTGVPVSDSKAAGLFPEFLVHSVATFTFLESMARGISISARKSLGLDRTESWTVTGMLIGKIASAVRSDGASLLCYNVNCEETSVDARLREILKAQGVPYIDISDAYTVDTQDLWVSGHWNTLGQRRVADALLPLLKEEIATRLNED